MNGYNRIIFISASDTSRSPMCEAIIKSMILNRPMEICSRGLVSLFPEPLNQKTEAVLISNGFKIENHESVQLEEKDFTEDSLVLVMEEQQKAKILTDYMEARNVYTLKEAVQETGDVKNPYGGPLTAYGECFEILFQLIEKLVIKLNEEEL